MPLYLFQCASCGHRFEELVAISKRDAVVCPKCGQTVGRVYEGSCAFGSKKCAGGESGGSGCSGHCAGCAGCGH